MAALYAGRLRVILNGVDPNTRLSRAAAETVARHLGPRLLGAICREETVAEALAAQRLVLDISPNSQAAEDLREIARGIEAALPPVAEPFSANWGAR
jgi:nitrogenase subunit NifH